MPIASPDEGGVAGGVGVWWPFATMAGALLSLALYLNRTLRPKLISRLPDPRNPDRDFVTVKHLPECPQVKLARLDGSLFFGAVSHVAETLAKMEEHPPGQRHLVVSATGINLSDVAGAEFLAKEAKRRRSIGGGLYLIRLKTGVWEPQSPGGYIDAIGRENLFSGKTEAIAAVTAKVDPEVCRTCTARIFLECAGKPSPDTAARNKPEGPITRGETLAATVPT